MAPTSCKDMRRNAEPTVLSIFLGYMFWRWRGMENHRTLCQQLHNWVFAHCWVRAADKSIGPQLTAGPSLPFCTPLGKDGEQTFQDRCAKRNRITALIYIRGFYEWYIGKSIKYQQESKYEACIVSVPSSQMDNSLCKRFSWPTFQAILFALDQISLKRERKS